MMKPNDQTMRWLTAGLIALGVAEPVMAQVVVRPRGTVPVAQAPAAVAVDDEQPDQPVSSGVSLDTNGDVDALFSKADQYAESGNYRNTLLLLNHISEKYPSVLVQVSDGLYLPARRAVERTIRRLPAEALALYRLDADGLLRGKLAGSTSSTPSGDPMGCYDEQALAEVVDQYFLADGGDKAAYMLACIRLDQGRWFEAEQLLRRIVSDYPNPKVDMTALRQRLAYAAIRSGDQETAKRTIAQLTLNQAVPDWLREAMSAASQTQIAHTPPSTDDLLMDAGVVNAGADGSGQWIGLWNQTTPTRWSTDLPEAGRRYGGQRATNSVQMRKRWLKLDWMPTAQAVIDGDRVYYKMGEVLRCVDKYTGAIVWSSQPSGEDDSRIMGQVNFGNVDWPSRPEERLFFVERIGRTIAVDGPTVYQIVGDHAPIGNQYGQIVLVNNRTVGRSIGNALVAMDATTGQMKWRTTIDSQIDQKTAGMAQFPTTRFLTTPVRYQAGGRDKATLLTVYEDEGEVRMAALSPTSGALLWHRFLCSTSEGYAPPGAAVALEVRDGVAYVVCGRGTVFAVNGRDGQVMWAANYRRDEPNNENQRHMGGLTMAWLRGPLWQDNVVMLTGERVLVVAADAAGVQVFDRRTGAFIGRFADPTADNANAKLNYVLGRRGDRLYLGGTESLACIDTNDGHVYWRSYLNHATGRGTLMGDAIFAPSGNTVVRIDVTTGKWVSQGAIIAGDDLPVGNLYTDGSVLLSVGMEEARGLADTGKAMAWLGRGIDAGRTNLLMVRATLYEQMNQTMPAIADMRAAHQRLDDPERKKQAGDKLLDMLLTQAARDGGNGKQWIDEAERLSGDVNQKTRVTLARADWLAARGDVAGAIAMNWPIMAGQPSLLKLDGQDKDWQVDPAVLASDRIRQWAADHPQAAAEPLKTITETALAEARKQSDAGRRLDALYPLAITAPSQPAAVNAMNDIVTQVQQPDEMQLARAELLLKRLANQAPPAQAAAAQMLLAQIYQKHNHPTLARNAWSQLKQRWPDQKFSDAPDARTAGELAAARIAALADAPDDAQPLTLPESNLRILWRLEKPETQPITLRNDDEFDDDAFLASHVILYDPSWRRLTCYDAQNANGATWSKQLPLSANMSVYQNGYQRQFLGVRQGHVLVLVFTDSMQAIDLLSGSILWTVKRESAPDQQRQEMNVRLMQAQMWNGPGRSPRDLRQTIDVGNGVVLMLEQDDEQPAAAAIDLFTGRTLWRRACSDNTITGVTVMGDRAVLVLSQGQQLWMGDLHTGKPDRTIDLADMNPNGQSLWMGDGVLYQNTSNNLAFASLTQPDSSWKLGGTERQRYVQRMCRLNDELAFIGWGGGQADLIETSSGKARWSSTDQNRYNNVFDAAVSADGESIAIISYVNNDMQLQMLDAANGNKRYDIKLSRSFNMNLRMDAHTMLTSGPVIAHLEASENRRPSAVLFNRASDGKKLDMHLQADDIDDLLREITQPPIIRNHALIVTTRTAVYAFGVKPGDKAETPVQPVGPAPDEAKQQTRTYTTPNGTTIRVRNGRAEVETPGGGVIRAKNINLNANGQRIEVKQTDGKIIVKVNGKTIEPDKSDDDEQADAPPPPVGPVAVPVPATVPAPAPANPPNK